jgi:hypothetical protein
MIDTLLALLRDAGHQVGAGGLPGAIGGFLGGLLGGGFGLGPLAGSLGGSAGSWAGSHLPPGTFSPDNLNRASNLLGALASGSTFSPLPAIGGEEVRQTVAGSGGVGDRVAAGAYDLASAGAYDTAKVIGGVVNAEVSLGKGIVNTADAAAQGAAQGFDQYINEQNGG